MNDEIRRSLRSEFCMINEVVDFPGESAHVFHVVEAFGNKPAERNTAETVLALLKTAHVRLLCVESWEGDAGPVLAQRASAVRARHVDPLASVEKGDLEWIAAVYLLHDVEFEVFGVENTQLRERVLALGRPLNRTRKVWSDRISELLGLVKGEVSLSPGYAEFLRLGAAQGDSLLPVEAYIDYAERLGVDTADLRGFLRISATKTLEATIDFEEANREAQQLQATIVGTLSNRERLLQNSFEAAGLRLSTGSSGFFAPQSEPGTTLTEQIAATPLARLLRFGVRRGLSSTDALQDPTKALALFERSLDLAETELVSAFQAQEQGYTGIARLFNVLMDFMPLFDVANDRFPNLVRYAHYLNRFAGTDLSAAIRELEQLKRRIVDRLAVTDADRRHASLVERLDHLLGLFRLACLPDDAKWLQARLPELDHDTICTALRKVVGGSEAIPAFAALEQEYEDRLDDTLRYYTLMNERGNTMARRTVQRMRDLGLDMSILVTGGHHRSTIAANLARLRMPNTFITPTVKRATSEEEMDTLF